MGKTVLVGVRVSPELKLSWEAAAAAAGLNVSAWLRQLAEVELASVNPSPQSRPVLIEPVPGAKAPVFIDPPPTSELVPKLTTSAHAGRLPANWRPSPKPKVKFDDPLVIPGVKTAEEIEEFHRLRRERGEFFDACLARGAHTVGATCRLCGGFR